MKNIFINYSYCVLLEVLPFPVPQVGPEHEITLVIIPPAAPLQSAQTKRAKLDGLVLACMVFFRIPLRFLRLLFLPYINNVKVWSDIVEGTVSMCET